MERELSRVPRVRYTWRTIIIITTIINIIIIIMVYETTKIIIR